MASVLSFRHINNRVVRRAFYIDKQYSGFLTWAPETKAYTPVPAGGPPITWEPASKMALEAIGEVIAQAEYFEKLMALWGQESSRNVTSPDLRTDNVAFIKTIGNKYRLREHFWMLTLRYSQDVSRHRLREHSKFCRTVIVGCGSIQTTGRS
jgi:hypothetical protein